MNLKNISWLRRCVYLWRNIRDKHSYNSGKNNRLLYNGSVRVGSRIQIIGNNNRVVLEKGCVLLNSLIKISGNNNDVILKAGSYVSGAELWVEDNNCCIRIGERSFIGHHSHLACTENRSQIILGEDCMVSSYVQVRTGDSHPILNNDGERINKAQSVNIGNHCWIGEDAKILKGVTLAGNVIVATSAVVTKAFSENVLIGGIPAKVIKENVVWQQERI